MVSIGLSVGAGAAGAIGGALGFGTGTVRPTVKLEPAGTPLLQTVEPLLIRTVVDSDLHRPNMFELTFLDESGSALTQARIEIGTELSVYGGAPDSHSAEKLITGEVTSIEGIYEDLVVYTIVRGYEKTHRLQRARRTRTFVDMTDSDIATKVARDAGLKVGDVESTSPVHTHISQVAQTDFEFLRDRCIEIGFEFGVDQGKFYFRRASGSAARSGGGLGGAMGALQAGASALGVGGAGGTTLTFKDNLISFRPRVSAACLTPEVEVRVWDPKTADVVVGKHKSESGTAKLHDKPADLADQFGKGFLGIPIPIPPIPGLPSLGPKASTKAFIVADRPLAYGSSASNVVDDVAAGVAEHVASTFAEAEGVTVGNPAIAAGKTVTIAGVGAPFAGDWVVTTAHHTFDDAEGGYRVRFSVSGRHDRSLFGLVRSHATDHSRIGPVIARVTNNNDPDKLGRVKLSFPWLAPDYESDWARVVQFGAGEKYGAMFVPEVGDEVLVIFEFGDARRPYVIGGLINGKSKLDLGGDAVKATGPMSSVVKCGFVSHAGHKLIFDDDALPLGSKSAITLATKDDKLGIKIDQANGKIEITCKPAPPSSQSPTGSLSIECGNAGTIDIKTGAGGTVNIDGGAQLNLKAQATVKIESTGPLELKGNPIKLN